MDKGLDSLKIASKRLDHKSGGYLEMKIADGVDKLNADKIVKQELDLFSSESRRKVLWWGEKREWKLICYCVLDASKVAWCSGCEAE